MATTKKTEIKKVNPNLKENLCCVLFFLLLPIFALVNNYSHIGAAVLGVTAALLIILFAVMDPPDEQLSVAHFGVYFAASMISVLFINFACLLQTPNRFAFNLDTYSAYSEHTPAALIIVAVIIALKIFVFKKYNKAMRNQFIRLVLDHLLTGSLFYGLIVTFQQYHFENGNLLLKMMAGFTLMFALTDTYDYYRTGSKRHHKTNIILSILLYVLMTVGMLVVQGVTTVDLLYGRFFHLLQMQLPDKILVAAVPMLMALVSYIVCFKGPFAASEVRTLSVYLLFALPIYLMTRWYSMQYGWMLLFAHTAILAFALFYKGSAGGKLEKFFAGHKEYRTAISGIILFICSFLMAEGGYLAMAALLAFAVVMVFILTRTKSIPGKVIWQVAMAGFTVLSVAVLLSLTLPFTYILAALMLWFISASAMYLFTRGKAQRIDKWLTPVIGISSFVLQLALCITML